MSFSNRIKIITSDVHRENFIDELAPGIFEELTVETIPTISEYLDTAICTDFADSAVAHFRYHQKRKEKGQ